MQPERFLNSPEVPKQKYAQDVFERLSEVETGVEVPRVSATRLSSGKDATLNLSIREKLGREGWDLDSLKTARTGSVVVNQTGEVFEVLEVKKGIIKIKDSETGMEGEIVAQPRSLRVHEYSYNLRDNSKHSKKIKVYDSVYKDHSLDTSDFIDSVVSSIPAVCTEVFDEIEIHPQKVGKAGAFRAEPSLFSDRRVLALYVGEQGYSAEEARKTIYHELGHAIARYLRGTTNPGERWKQTMQADGNDVSEYAAKTRYPKQNDTGEIEDFADTVMMYLATDGAKSDQARALRDFCKNRFQKLDEILTDLLAQQSSGRLASLKRKISKPAGSLEN